MYPKKIPFTINTKWRAVKIISNGADEYELFYLENRLPLPLTELGDQAGWKLRQAPVDSMSPSFADLLWVFDEQSAKMLSQINLQKIMNSGGKILIPADSEDAARLLQREGFRLNPGKPIRLGQTFYVTFLKEKIPCCGSVMNNE